MKITRITCLLTLTLTLAASLAFTARAGSNPNLLKKITPPPPLPTFSAPARPARLAASRQTPLDTPTTPARTFDYTLATLGPEDPPTLQWTNETHLIVNGYSNGLFYLEHTLDLLAPWTIVEPVIDGEVVEVATTNDAEFFRLVRIEHRYYITMLTAPDASTADMVHVIPEWTLACGHGLQITNLAPSWPVFSNDVIVCRFPSAVTNLTYNWPCAMVTEVWPATNANGVYFENTLVYMNLGDDWCEFEPGYVLNPAIETASIFGTNDSLYLNLCYIPDAVTNKFPTFPSPGTNAVPTVPVITGPSLDPSFPNPPPAWPSAHPILPVNDGRPESRTPDREQGVLDIRIQIDDENEHSGLGGHGEGSGKPPRHTIFGH